MPDVNSIVEGLEGLEYPSNFGNNMGGLDFPDSLAADYMGGLNCLIFSGKDSFGGFVDSASFPSEVSGNFGPACPIYGMTGYIYMPASTAQQNTDPSSAGTDYALGWGRMDWRDYIQKVNYNVGAPNLRSYFQLPRQDVNPLYDPYVITGTGFRKFDQSITSLLKINILDLISEGPIEGFVTGDYIYNLSGKKAGDIGYTSAKFSPYTNNTGTAAGKGALSFFKATPETRSIFWNNTPIATMKGFMNFQYANYKYTNGEPNNHTISRPYMNLYQDRFHWDGNKVDVNKYPIQSASTKLINEALYGGNFFQSENSGYATPRRYYIYDTDIQAVKILFKINALYFQNLTGSRVGEMDRNQVKVQLRLYRLFSDRTESLATIETATADNPYLYTTDNIQFYGKVTAPMVSHYTFWFRQYKDNAFPIRVLPNQIGWVLDITKLTAENISAYTASSIEVASLSYIYGDRFTFPNAALVHSTFDARYFSSIPERSYYVRLLKVKIPENYDPILKTYNGPWNGKFKLAWTDNPTWCYYDMITNNRFGLGKYVDPSLVDKWTLYEASQYCDQLVPDGKGGLEPRFTCNLYINTRTEAYKIINDMASIFSALPYYMAGQIFISQDRPKEPIYLFNNSNVINGNFTYSDSAKRTRRSVAMVRYNDENNNYKPAYEYVEDKTSMMRYGIREVEIAAFGGTRGSQARRLGKWFLASENLETETVNFETSIEGSLLRPGDVIQIYDQNRRNKIYAGRTIELNTGSATLDIEYNEYNKYILTGVNQSFIFSTLTPTYNLNLGTALGNELTTGYGLKSDGITGLNSKLFRKNQIQNLKINNTKNYITNGTGYFEKNIRILFDKDTINTTSKFTPVLTKGNVISSGNGFVKTLDNPSWDDTQVYSEEGYYDKVFAKVIPVNNYGGYNMFGLNSDPATSTSHLDLDYAWYFIADGTLQIRLNGSVLSGITWTNYNKNETYTIDYDGQYVNFLSGTNNIYKEARSVGNRLYFDSSLYNKNAGFTDVKFGTYGLDNKEYNLPKNAIWSIDVSTTGDYGGYTSGIQNRYPTKYVPGNLLYDGWYLESYLDKLQSYRVINIQEKEKNGYNITCLEYNPLKYVDIDTGVALITVPEKNPIPETPDLGLQILYRDELGNKTGSNSLYYNSYQTKGLNSVAYLITGKSGPRGSGIVSNYKVYVSSGLQSFSSSSLPPAKDLFSIYNNLPTNTYTATTIPPYFTPTVSGDYTVTLIAENNSNEFSDTATKQIQLSQQTIPAVVVASGVNVL